MSKEGLCREEQTRGEEGRRDREVKEKGEERGGKREKMEREERKDTWGYICLTVNLFFFF